MTASELLTTRRSVRKFKDTPVDRETMVEIIEMARFSPSWANTQVARYTLIDNKDVINEIAEKGVSGFVYNVKSLKDTHGVAVLSFVKGKSGNIGDKLGDKKLENSVIWEVFDAGIACQTFCLAAHEKGIGTCIFGIINDKEIAKIINLPDDETVGALIIYGYPDQDPKIPPRLSVEEIARFI
ncbi:nitroreductase [Candidatus Epulonipiscium fishelsonii]|uniref:Nitroreductase n=1 Tax=Candidatus Epulonipiscium fishelsonii TaxID=77094 RepID=A0ACC8XFM0_9FIRM|nr:nitroreductase [Epulopiscium sp. SCG-B05WGA-EpuloA1]ONI42047.1 nitroreductase [Epulopiscium sp. SCG-B11WGA-EpuloA1]ONI46680.1 nitroreductase [Epulopiscium sp. SCG-C06WGA-EpuloA1]